MIAATYDEDHGVYTATWDNPPIHAKFDRLRWDRYGELSGEVTVTSTEPFEKDIYSAKATMTTVEGRQKLAGHCAKRAPEIDADWLGMFDAACVVVRNAFRRGEPAVLASDAPDIEPGDAQIRDQVTGDVVLPRNELSIVFGDPAAAKSTTVDGLFASMIHTGRSDIAQLEAAQATVGILDYETSLGTQKARLKRMFGEFYPKDLVLIPGSGVSLPNSVDRLRGMIREHRIGYLIIDSIAYACGGPPEDAVVAANFLNALQQLGLGSSLGVCAIGHVTKADARGQAEKPFGSNFWHASARMTWFAKRNEGAGERFTVGLFCKKNNLGPRSRAIGLTLDYANDGLVFGRSDVVSDPELGAEVKLSVRIQRQLLQAARAMTYGEIADELGADPNVVKETCRRSLGSLFVKVPGEGREVRIGLKAHEAAA